MIIMTFCFLSVSVNLLLINLKKDKVTCYSTALKETVISKGRGDIYDIKMRKLVNDDEKDIIIQNPNSIIEIETAETLNDKNIITAKKYNRYKNTSFACHIIGYVNSDNQGVSGIEKSFDDYLTSQNRTLSVRYFSDTSGKLLSGGGKEIIKNDYYSKKGVQLTIDREIQKITENALRLYNIDKGCAIVTECDTGYISAMASTPVFERNNLEKYLNDENFPFINRALCSYNVGSVFKLTVAAAAIKYGYDDFVSVCNGSAKISDRTFACSNYTKHGKIDLKTAFSVSCNTYFLRLAIKIGKEKLVKTAKALGFGKEDILWDDIISSAGNLPDTSDLISDGDIANFSFGQGELCATPLQIASCYSAAVNGGKRISPVLVKEIIDEKGKTVKSFTENNFVYRAVDEKTSQKLKSLLEYNFQYGNCKKAKPVNGTGGGKTSTAETGKTDKNGRKILNSWFAGFTETAKKKYVIVVLKENGISGATDCAPVFKEIAERLIIYDK